MANCQTWAITGPEIPGVNDEESVGISLGFKPVEAGFEIINKAVVNYDTTFGEERKVDTIDTLFGHEVDIDFFLGMEKSPISVEVDKERVDIKIGKELIEFGGVGINLYEEEGE